MIMTMAGTSIFAGTMGPICTKGNVTVPCAQQTWGLGAQALYLKPTYAGFDYTSSLIDTTGSTETYRSFNHNAGWMWVNYFSAFTVPNAGAGGAGVSDFSLNGPFVGLSWAGGL